MHGRSRKMTLFTVILFQQITIISMYVHVHIQSCTFVQKPTHTHTQGLYNNSNNNGCYGMKSVAVGEEEEDE